MTIKRFVVISTLLLAAAALSGCISIYEGADSVCPGGNPAADNWPYCGTATPGGDD